MAFNTDQQTLNDLHIFGRHGGDSIFDLFNRTATRNGAALLEDLFRHPLANAHAVRRRAGVFQYFISSGAVFPFRTELFDIVEAYLAVTDERTRLTTDQKALSTKVIGLMGDNNEYKAIYNGVRAMGEIVQVLAVFLRGLSASPDGYQEELEALDLLLAGEASKALLQEDLKNKTPYARLAELDGLVRFRYRQAMRRILQYIYQLDVYLTVGKVGVSRGFVFPTAFDLSDASDPLAVSDLSAAGPGQRRILLEKVFHPLVENAVPNTLDITSDQSVIFLTGANMAGKSTFMKTLGICVFLAHMGFPVPAARMEFAVLDGIFTSINLPDDLGMGASHFYAEVLRVKKIARELSVGKNLFVVFDELFRGTNVKDAYEATVALTSAFAERHHSIFVISTHIIEAGELLAQQNGHIRFLYLPTRMKGNQPIYTYTLESGITADRHGMVIVNNEGILGLLAAGVPDNRPVAGFIVDKQTQDDLNLIGKYKPGSIYSLFNKVHTSGAERLLETMFQQPLCNVEAINQRSRTFEYFQEKRADWPFARKQFDEVEEYLHGGAADSRLMVIAGVFRLRVYGAVMRDDRYSLILQGVTAVISLLRICRAFIGQLDMAFEPLKTKIDTVVQLLDDPRLADLPDDGNADLSWLAIARYHHLFGRVLHQQLAELCVILYELDLGITVGRVAEEKGLTYARALPREPDQFHAEELRHPGLDRAVGNTITLDQQRNVLFLTGANMAGKSTLMKSFGIALYLGHMGFPVAAKNMRFSVKEGLYSSINVADDLSQGYSHFYAEVLRVKTVAEAVSRGRHLVVIFDELFKGTNVKDAYDATLAVTAAFAGYKQSSFVISTHIIEVGETLRRQRSDLQFAYLPTIMEGIAPRYTYRLEEGITADKHGMLIIENEGILETIRCSQE